MTGSEAHTWRAVASSVLARIEVGALTVVEPDGRRHTFGNGRPTATIALRDARFWGALLRGSRGLADSYAAGFWDSPDLVAVFRLAARNAYVIDRVRRLTMPLWLAPQRLRALGAPSTRHRRRRDVAAHYDLGNDLFKRMLDPTMTYSCALFEREGLTLEQASAAKLQRVCEQLALGPGDHVLEVGTGWAGFAVHAAATYGCRVTTTTLSAEQHAYAVMRVREAGLSDHVTVLRHDYRDVRGRYDKLVCIEMIEAVGWRQLGRFFASCSQLLTTSGAMFLQAITVDDRAYELEKASRSFMKEQIFPGGSLPSLEVITRHLARRTDLQTLWLQDITDSYVLTLQAWRANFLAAWSELRSLGYDEHFLRLWTLYLAYCEAGFAERRICDIQLLAAKPRWAIAEGEHGSSRPLAIGLTDAADVAPRRERHETMPTR